MSDTNDRIHFYIPNIEIIKGKPDSNGDIEMFIKGVASTETWDSQDELLSIDGMDLSGFDWINWNHKGKDDSAALIGEVTKSEKITKPNGVKQILVEGKLFNNVKMAVSTWDLMNSLNKSESKVKLGLSVEGKVVLRDPLNNKKVIKSKITSMAICPVPINGETIVDLLKKGYTEELEPEYDEISKGFIDDFEKSMDIEATEPIHKESVEGGVKNPHEVEDEKKKKKNRKKLTKSDIVENIFSYFSNIDLEKAKQIYVLIQKIAIMEKKPEANQETINKAYEILGLDNPNNSDGNQPTVPEFTLGTAIDLIKGDEKLFPLELSREIGVAVLITKGHNQDTADDAMDMTYEDGKKKKKKKKEEKKEKMEGDDGYVAKAEQDNINAKGFEDIEKSLQSFSTNIDNKFSAIGEIMQNNNEQNGILKAQLDEVQEKLEAISQTPMSRKSAGSATQYQDRFQKSEDGNVIVNINDPTQRKMLISKLNEVSGLNKGDGEYDRDLTDAAQELELVKGFTQQTLVKLAPKLQEMKIEIVRE